MKPRRCLAIVNPEGGARQGRAVLDEVQQAFTEAGVELDAHLSQHAGHAAELARELSFEDYDALCVVGGDGTVHDVVNGLMLREDPPNLPLGLIPAGTGNTLHQQLGMRDVPSAVNAILEGNLQWLDVVEVRTAERVTHCVNIVGWGGIADINAKAERLRYCGHHRYTLAALWQILWPVARHARLTLDDEEMEGTFQFVIGCVTRSTGTGMLLAPRAEIDDGKVDVVILRAVSRRQLLQVFRRVFDGSHLELPFVEYRQVSSFSMDAAPSQLNLDGEIKGSSPFEAKVIPRAIRVVSLA